MQEQIFGYRYSFLRIDYIKNSFVGTLIFLLEPVHIKMASKIIAKEIIAIKIISSLS